MSTEYGVYRGVVHTANQSTGEATVRIPSLLGAEKTVSVSPKGLVSLSGTYPIPAAGTPVYVAVSSDQSQYYWLTALPQVLPGEGEYVTLTGDQTVAGDKTFSGLLTANSGVSTTSVTATGTVSGSTVSATGTVSGGTLTTTGAVSSGSLTVDTDVLVVDAVNNRVGVNNAGPSYTLDVSGIIRADHASITPIVASGAAAGLAFEERDDAGDQWIWYATGGTARLYNGSDYLTVADTTGLITTSGGVTVGGTLSVGASNLSVDTTSTPDQQVLVAVNGGTATWQHRGVSVFSNTTTRDAAITSPAGGEVVYLSSTPELQVYDGGAWSPLMPSGSITQFAGSSAPTGWLLCDGSAVSRTTYARLFAVIGTTYGVGDGSTTFNLPDLQGRVPVGYDSGQTEFDALGETGGTKTHTLTTGEMPSHSHSHTHSFSGTTASDGSHSHSVTAGLGGGDVGLTAGASNYNLLEESKTTSTAGSHTHTYSGTTGSDATTSGSGGAHNNLQPYIALHYIIKA